MPTIAFLGAGSVVFTRQLVTDLLRYPDLPTLDIALHDIDGARLEVARLTALNVARQLGRDVRVTASLDRRSALAGADFVINMIQVGGVAATRLDLELPAARGLRQTIGDTTGVGGVFRALRTFPVLSAIAADMSDLCPDAWFLNYTNPMVMNVWWMSVVAPRIRTVGLCHSVYWTVHDLCALVGVPLAGTHYRAAGVNHQSWLVEWSREGRDLYPLLRERIAADPDLQRRVRAEIFARVGHYPTETSEHSSEYLDWFLRSDAQIERFRIEPLQYIGISEDNVREFLEAERLLAAGQDVPLHEEGDAAEYAPQVIHAMLTGEATEIHANVPNRGLIDNLPRDAVVEVPARVGADGLHPIAMGSIPVAGRSQPHLPVGRGTDRARRTGGRPRTRPSGRAARSERELVAHSRRDLGAVRRADPGACGAAAAGTRRHPRHCLLNPQHLRARRRARPEVPRRRTDAPFREEEMRNHRSIRTATVATAAGALLVLAGCAGPQGATVLDAEADVTITWWTGQSEQAEAILEGLAAEFEELHPNVTVDISPGASSTEELLQKLSAGFAGNSYPNISYAFGSWASELESSQRTLDITEQVSDPAVGWQDFSEAARATVQPTGKSIIGFPALVDNLSLIYNKTVFDAAGVEYPTADWTWDDFRAAAKRLTDPTTETYGYAYSVSGSEETTWQFWPHLWQSGGEILSEGGGSSAFASPEGAEALELLRKMAVDDGSVYLDQTDTKFAKLFAADRIGMMTSGPWQLSDLKTAGTSYGVTVLPGTDGDHQTVSGPDIWALFDTRDANENHWSVELMKWLTAPEQDLRWNVAYGNLPLRASEIDTPEFQAQVAALPGLDVMAENSVNAISARPTVPGYVGLSEAVGGAISRLLQGEGTTEDALAEAAEKADEALADR